MMRHDLYAEARILLLKAIPLTRENKDAYKQITICEKVIQTKELSNLLMTANDILVKNTESRFK